MATEHVVVYDMQDTGEGLSGAGAFGAGTYEFGTGATLVTVLSVRKGRTYNCEANTADEALRGVRQAFPGSYPSASYAIKKSSGAEG